MEIKTDSLTELVDITPEVENEVRSIGIKEGVCIVTIPHISAGLMIGENENGFLSDVINLLSKLVPPGDYQAVFNTNAEAQLKAILLDSSKVIPVVDGEIKLGRWQRLFFVELDGPRDRSVNVMVIKKE